MTNQELIARANRALDEKGEIARAMLAALKVVRMSRGWYELPLDTRVLVDDAIAQAEGGHRE